MDFFRSKDAQSSHQQIPEPQTKRISTPAGQRLSVILENGSATAKARENHRSSVRKSGLSAALADVPRESVEDRSNNSSGYSTSVWSDGEKFGVLRNHKQIAKRGGWKRLAIIIGIILLCIVALAVGLALGLKKKSSSSNASNSSSAQAGGSGSGSTSPSSPGSSTSPSNAATSSLPSNFPVGTYSMITFLDTVQTNCTSNPNTWTCYPYTDYNTNPSKAFSVFNWIISGSEGAYKISSTDNPFSIEFKNADLELLDQGQDSEHYRFQISATKTVSPSGSLTDDNSAVECDFSNTNLQAYLYTKMKSSYPDDTVTYDKPSNTIWPFGVRVEQLVSGGEGVPSCYKSSNGQHGDQISLDATDAGALCSCLYKNWRTPS